MTKGLLLHLGCDVTTVRSADDCLQAVSPEYKVVFLDLCMPGLDGHEAVIRRIRERFTKRHEGPLLVALTGNKDRLTKENCLRVGINGVILKPVSVDKMRTVLSEVLEHRCRFETY